MQFPGFNSSVFSGLSVSGASGHSSIQSQNTSHQTQGAPQAFGQPQQTQTNGQAFAQATAPAFYHYLIVPLAQIVQQMLQNGIPVTADNLMQAWGLPVQKGKVDGFSSGVVDPPPKKSNALVSPVAGKCDKRIERGTNEGKYCGKTANYGTRCKAHAVSDEKKTTSLGNLTVAGIQQSGPFSTPTGIPSISSNLQNPPQNHFGLGQQGPILGQQGLGLGQQGLGLLHQLPNSGQQGPALGQKGVSLGQQGVSLGQQGVSLGQQGVSLSQQGVSLGQQGVSLGQQGGFGVGQQNGTGIGQQSGVHAGQHVPRQGPKLNVNEFDEDHCTEVDHGLVINKKTMTVVGKKVKDSSSLADLGKISPQEAAVALNKGLHVRDEIVSRPPEGPVSNGVAFTQTQTEATHHAVNPQNFGVQAALVSNNASMQSALAGIQSSGHVVPTPNMEFNPPSQLPSNSQLPESSSQHVHKNDSVPQIPLMLGVQPADLPSLPSHEQAPSSTSSMLLEKVGEVPQIPLTEGLQMTPLSELPIQVPQKQIISNGVPSIPTLEVTSL
jgi:hypothetical protein